jgi:hypothetical protein
MRLNILLELEVSALPRFCAGLIGSSFTDVLFRDEGLGLHSQKSEDLKCACLKSRKIELILQAEYVGLF